MKRLLVCLLALLLALNGLCAFAETENHLTVGTTTALSGNFFTDMWGSNTADMDVRALIHGCNMVEWSYAMGAFRLNSAVVREVTTADDNGNRVYTITLNDGLRYSDGSKITAWDYAFSILLSAAPEMKAIGAATTGADYILGINDYKNYEYDAGDPQPNVLSGVRVLSSNKLAITVRKAYLPFFYEMALLNYVPYPISEIAPGCKLADDGEGVYICNSAKNAEEPLFTAELLQETILNPETGYMSHPTVVSGPYRLVSFDGETAEFEKNKYFNGNSDGSKPAIAALTYKTVRNEDMIAALENGEVDLLNKVTNAQAVADGSALTNGDHFVMSDYARSGFSFISFSCERPTVGEQAVRQAIAMCLNKDALVEGYVGENGTRVDGYYGEGQWMVQLLEGKIEAPIVKPDAETATEEEKAAYEAEKAEWDALEMNLPTYALDVNAAAAKLDEAGWNLNRNGEAFDPANDDVRCKEIDGELVALDLMMIYPEGNAIGDYLQANFVDNLAQAGVKLTVEAVPMTELLEIYYRQQERGCDMIYLATNFNAVFDPSTTFDPDDAYQGVNNRTGIADQQLYELAVAMRKTEPGDLLGYCRNWLAFQQRWAEVLPAIPVYSNTYYDFYTASLKDYNISANTSWAQAIVSASLK